MVKIKSYKPDATVDILPATSNGVHPPLGIFYERKVRFKRCPNEGNPCFCPGTCMEPVEEISLGTDDSPGRKEENE